MSRELRKLRKRCEALSKEAAELRAHGQTAAALERYVEALDMAGRLADADPGEAWPLLRAATLLLDLADLYLHEDGEGQALDLLEECGQICDDLSERHQVDTRPLIADANLKRGIAKHNVGLGASAVVELDEAVTGYLELLRETGDADARGRAYARDLSVALVAAGQAQMKYGDPDLAVRSADLGWRGYLGQHDVPGWTVARMGWAASTAAGILARTGQLDSAVDADSVAVRAFGECVEIAGYAADQRSLAIALARWGLHLQAIGRPEDSAEATAHLAEGRRLDAAAAQEAAADWDRIQSERPKVTLAAALETAAEMLSRERVAALPVTFTGPHHESISTPSGRCDPQVAAPYAADLAGLAVDLLPLAAEEGLRIGLEAHYTFAVAWRANPLVRHQIREWGIPWARLILTCCRALDPAPESTDLLLALDLASWNLGLIDRLLPPGGEQHDRPAGGTGNDDPETRELLRDCLISHADLLAVREDHEQVRLLRERAASLAPERSRPDAAQ